jgi:hypothetical protein
MVLFRLACLTGPSVRHPHAVSSMFTDRRPDKDKNEEELRVELGQLRDVWRLDQDELKKLHAVSEMTGLRSCTHANIASP